MIYAIVSVRRALHFRRKLKNIHSIFLYASAIGVLGNNDVHALAR